MKRYCLALLAVLIVGCGAESAPTALPSDTPDPVATTVASIKITLTAEAARMPSATPTDTPTLTATVTPTVTPTPTPLPPPRLEGQVLDAASDEPLVGAQVAANERQTTTNSDGRFLFADLAPGQYTVLVTSADHDPVLSGILDLRAGQEMVVDAALPAAGTGDYPRDPMASNQIDPAGAPTAQEAERLARLQGLQGEVVSVQETVLEGEYLVNYRKGDAIRSAMATLHHPAWELVDGAGQAWYIIRVCGNLALARPAAVEVPAECVAQPRPVVMVGGQAISGYACPSETCKVVAELPPGWNGVAQACAPGCGWLRVQCPGDAGKCWVRREWLEAWGNLAELPVLPVAVSGQIAFFSDRESPGYGEIYLMNSDGSDQTRLTSDLRVSSTRQGGPPGVIYHIWSPARARFLYNWGGRVYSVGGDGSDKALVANQVYDSHLITFFDLSPDGQRLIYTFFDRNFGGYELATMDFDGRNRTPLPGDAIRSTAGLPANANLGAVAWSPDGTKIAFTCGYGGDGLCLMNPDGTSAVRITPSLDILSGTGLDWSPEGDYIAFSTLSHITIDLHYVHVTSGRVFTLVQNNLNCNADWSPDGHRIAFSREDIEDGNGQVWVINVDGTGLTQLTFDGQNCCPVWVP